VKLGLVLSVLSCVLLGANAADASHNWGGIDVCKTYRDRVPPGIEPSLLPEHDSRGAKLLQRYCTQCHELPGPGHHTAAEWPAVLERMLLLMDVSQRFRGLMGNIAAPSADERAALGAYLEAHALEPMRGTPRGPGAAVFRQHCGTCHALPDPGQHDALEWTAVVRRMQRNAEVMQRGRFDAPAQQAVLTYLAAGGSTQFIGDPHGAGVPTPVRSDAESDPPGWTLGRLAYLTPFFGVAGLGGLRWWRAEHARKARP